MEEHCPKKVLDRVRDAIRLKHYYRTEQAYAGWIKCCIYFHNVRHPVRTRSHGCASLRCVL